MKCPEACVTGRPEVGCPVWPPAPGILAQAPDSCLTTEIQLSAFFAGGLLHLQVLLL